jgi:predicted ATPase/DNA-binding CsgD family transcriptional regulator
MTEPSHPPERQALGVAIVSQELASHPAPIPLREVASSRSRQGGAAPIVRRSRPRPLTSLVGREADVAAVRALFLEEGVRLLTLTGPGGVGKTRLALAVAEAGDALFADGAVFVELASVRDPALVPTIVAESVGVQDAGVLAVRDSLIGALRERELLLAIDNFEHVLPAALLVADLLAACPGLRILVSSRAPLALSGERLWPVAPLALPAEGAHDPLASPAMILFAERARAVVPGFRLDAENAGAVAEICRRLDGLPLAVELAAARVRLLDPAALLARMEPRHRLLTGGGHDRPARLRTIEDAIAWSYDLLAPAEQWLLRRLSVFAGGFTLEAVEAVTPHSAADPLAALQTLVDHSLVSRRTLGEPSRFTMLETIREFAFERLTAAGEARDARDAHARWCLGFAEQYAPDYFVHDDVVARAAMIAAEHANLLAALAHLDAAGAGDQQIRLAALLGPFWFHHSVGRACLESALARPTTRLGDEAVALGNLARLATFQGDFGAAAAALERAVDRAAVAGTARVTAFVVTCQAILVLFEGRFAAATARATEAETIAAGAGESFVAAFARFVGARARHYGGDLTGAEAHYTGLLADSPPPRFAAALYHHSLAMIARTRGRPEVALPLYAAALDVVFATGELLTAASCLEDIATVLAALDRAESAARLFGAAAAFRKTIGVPMAPPDVPDYARAVEATRARLGPVVFAAAGEGGSALPPAEAVAAATALARSTASEAGRAAEAVGLSRREREVLRLLVDGLSDKEIGAVLAISRHTASKHVGVVLAKLGVDSRTAAAAVALRDGLV